MTSDAIELQPIHDETKEQNIDSDINMRLNVKMVNNLSSSEVASQWLSENILKIENPLVVILGIGEYSGMPNLDGITKDYQHMIKIFNKLFGYDILYKLKNNQFNKNKSDGNIQDEFKIRWSIDEVDDFIDESKSILGDKTRKYDALIFIISCHGESGVLLDSDCEEIIFYGIASKFDGSSFPFFAECPKLFFVDACRGQMKSKPIPVEFGINQQTNEIILVNKGQENKTQQEKREQKQLSVENNIDSEIVVVIDDEKTVESSRIQPREVYGKQVYVKEVLKVEQVKQLLVQKNINIHKEANFLFVYANPDGYAAFDGGNKGGYLIQAIYKVFRKKEIVSKDLNSIIYHVADKVKQLVGPKSMQHLQTVSNVHYKIKFCPKLKKV